MRDVITKGGRGGQKVAIFYYVQYVLNVISRGSGDQKTPKLDYVIHGWPLS